MIPTLNLDKIKTKVNLKEIIQMGDIEIEAIYTRDVVKTNATGAKINFPRRHIGKKVFILVPKK